MRHLSKTAVVFALLALWISATAFAPDTTPGRWKKGPNGACTWDEKDTGPDQCTPPKGRFKKDGDKCVWVANEVGDNQCRPAKGRFKKDGEKCNWDANDDGPDQCKPR